MNTAPRHLLTGSAAVLIAGWGSGCVDSNSRATVGETVKLQTFEPTPPIPEEYPQDQRSLTGLDRSNWAGSTFLVPVDGTHHRPTYADPFFIANVTRRQRGEYPTLESALDMDGAEYGSKASQQRFAEGFLVPGRAFVDAVAMPVRLIGEPQTWEYVSPRVNYERQPLNRAVLLPPPMQNPDRPETHADKAEPAPAAPESFGPAGDPR